MGSLQDFVNLSRLAPHFFYRGGDNGHAFDDFLNAHDPNCNILTLIGSDGLGKTSMLLALDDTFSNYYNDHVVVVHVFYPSVPYLELLHSIAEKLSKATNARLGRSPRDSIINSLNILESDNKRLILLIDDAERLPLGSLRGLLNLSEERYGYPRISIILAGTDELEETFADPDNADLSDRLTLKRHLHPLGSTEARDFVSQWMAAAGASSNEVMQPSALDKLIQYGRGEPKLINSLCIGSLRAAAETQKGVVTDQLVEGAAKELEIETDYTVLDSNIDGIEFTDLTALPPQVTSKVSKKVYKTKETQKLTHSLFKTAKAASYAAIIFGGAYAVWQAYPDFKDYFAGKETITNNVNQPNQTVSSLQLGSTFLTPTAAKYRYYQNLETVVDSTWPRGRLEISSEEGLISSKPSITNLRNVDVFSFKVEVFENTVSTVSSVANNLSNIEVTEDQAPTISNDTQMRVSTQLDLNSTFSSGFSNNDLSDGSLQGIEDAFVSPEEQLAPSVTPSPAFRAVKSPDEPSETNDDIIALLAETGAEKEPVTIESPQEIATPQTSTENVIPDQDQLTSDQQIQISALLAQADEQFQIRRYTQPVGSNAAKSYREVLEIDPENQNAKDGLTRIFQRYQGMTERAIKRGELARGKRLWERAKIADAKAASASPLEKILNSEANADNTPAVKQDTSGTKTTLMAAAASNDVGTLNTEISNSANINLLDKDGKSALFYAVQAGAIDTTRVLIANNADINSASKTGRTPLMRATWLGHQQITELLLSAGASPNSLANNGWSALGYAAVKGDAAIITSLLNNGANVEQQMGDGKTALQLSAWNGRADATIALLRANAQIDSLGTSGWTPMMYAAWNGHIQIIRTLVNNGANINAKNNDGWTSLMNAAWRGDALTVDALLSLGIDVTLQTPDGRTAYDLAVEKNENAIARRIGR